MTRASTTSDPFNAIAEPRRRHILEFIAGDERSVTDIAGALELGPQPRTSCTGDGAGQRGAHASMDTIPELPAFVQAEAATTARGQLLVYLRLLDVPVPSVYGPTADENPFAAVAAGGAR